MILCRYLDTNGDGTGTVDAIGDYSTVTEFYYEAPELGATFHRMIVSIEDNGGGTISEYGNLGAGGLTNGIEVKVVDDSDTVMADLTDGLPIKSNGDWGRLCYDIDRKDWGGGNDFYQVRWTFSKSGEPVILREGWRLVVYLNDDFTNLVGHHFMVQGNR